MPLTRATVRHVLAVLVIALVATVPERARADDTPDVQHSLSVTFSPLHLTFAVLEAEVEARLADQLGASLIVGLGSRTTSSDARSTVYELGGQFRWYAIGSFIHGLHFGAEVMFIGATAEWNEQFAAAEGLAIGPFVGYKIATNIAFTFEIQAGAQAAVAHASSDTKSANYKDVIPLLNLNFGWSF